MGTTINTLNIDVLHSLIGRCLAHVEALDDRPTIAADLHQATLILDSLCVHLESLADALPPPTGDWPEASRSSHHSG
jgi:hypothetical protein